MLKRFVIFCIFIFVFYLVPADTTQFGQDYPPLRAYQLTGLTRTHPGILKPYLDPYLERPFSPALQESMVQSLRSLGIFHTVRIDPLPDGNGGVEAWFLFPWEALPAAVASTEG